MEVVPTGDGDDDGVIWFRCPQCQGFLPKLGGALDQDESAEDDPAGDSTVATTDAAVAPADDEAGGTGDDMPWDSPADMIASRGAQADVADVADADAPATEPVRKTWEKDKDAGKSSAADKATGPAPEPLAEYAALLAALDPATAVPYRPWQTYETGQCVHHLAWDDCGVVVAKEDIPGGRHVIKCYFSEAGVVRLIEQAPR